jgi:C-terminal processing protease CtpA/Prc
MKNLIIVCVVIVAVLTIISAPHLLKQGLEKSSAAPREPVRTEEAKPEPVTLDRDVVVPVPEAVVHHTPPPKQVIAPVVEKPTPPKAAAAAPPDPALLRWNRMARKFEQQQEQLALETDPAKRLKLIRALSSYVRIDTLTAIDWAIGLQDPYEQQAALEAVNHKALVGIGAKIQVDETGFPRIRETTVMSAVAATGQVEAGDYIVGMDDGTGTPVYFEGIATRKVAQHLRGPAGSELRLFMERVAPDGNTAQVFDVIVQRSLLVVEPPY